MHQVATSAKATRNQFLVLPIRRHLPDDVGW